MQLWPQGVASKRQSATCLHGDKPLVGGGEGLPQLAMLKSVCLLPNLSFITELFWVPWSWRWGQVFLMVLLILVLVLLLQSQSRSQDMFSSEYMKEGLIPV